MLLENWNRSFELSNTGIIDWSIRNGEIIQSSLITDVSRATELINPSGLGSRRRPVVLRPVAIRVEGLDSSRPHPSADRTTPEDAGRLA